MNFFYSNLIQQSQQPYIATSNVQPSQTSPLQLPIKNQNRYSSVQNIPDINTLNSVQKSPRKQSPSKQSSNQQLTILCNLSAQPNSVNQYSSSSSSSKSPARSRSPSSNKIDYDENRMSSNKSVQKISQINPQENIIKYQSESLSKINKYYSTINNSTLLNNSIKRSFKSSSNIESASYRERRSSRSSFILSNV